MTFNELAKLVPALLRWGGAVELVSPPGRGKSTFVEEIIKEHSTKDHMGGLAIAFLGTYTPVDMLGFMVPQKHHTDTRGDFLRSTFTEPTWMTTEDGRSMSDFPWGMLFLDEYGQAEPDVKKASANLLLNGKLGPHRLPPGWVVWAASNRTSDRSGVTKSYDFVINRRLEIHIKDDIEGWITWAQKHDVHPTLVSFAEKNPNIVFTESVPDKQGPWCTPRSLVMASRLLECMSGRPGVLPEGDQAIQHTAGLIGAGAATQLAAHIRLEDKIPVWADILAQPTTCRLPEQPDAQMLVCFHTSGRVDAKSLPRVITYIKRLPKEFQSVFVKYATRRDGLLMSEKDMVKWVTENATLMSSIMAA